MTATTARRRVWPFVVGGLAVVVLLAVAIIVALVFEGVKAQQDEAYTRCVEQKLAGVSTTLETDEYTDIAVAAARECSAS